MRKPGDGKLVRVKDVGRAELGAENYGRSCASTADAAWAWASSSSPPPTRSTCATP